MRYTTIIDISEFPIVYKNPNIRLLYLHMVLKSGYHDDDRDKCFLSIRRLASDIGLTLSATRHALGILQKLGLIFRENDFYYVKKFVLEKPISPRVRSEKKQKEAEIRERERQIQSEQEQREKEEKRRYLEMRKSGRNPLKEMVIELMARAENGDQEAKERLPMYKQIVQQIKAERL